MTDEQLWEQFTAAPTREHRDALILRYTQLVQYVAGRVAVGLPGSIDQEDLVSYGMFGLIDAIERFDPERGYKFETYAMARIKGAIIDELRDLDWVPRSVRDKARAVAAARTKLEASGASVSHQALAGELGLSNDALNKMLAQIAVADVGSLDRRLETNENGVDPPAQDVPALAVYELDEIRVALLEALGTLTDREAIVFNLYYRYGLIGADIGVVLGVTEARIVQIRSEGLARLYRALTSGASTSR